MGRLQQKSDLAEKSRQNYLAYSQPVHTLMMFVYQDYQPKMQGKVHADAKRQAKQSSIHKRVFIILKQDKINCLKHSIQTSTK